MHFFTDVNEVLMKVSIRFSVAMPVWVLLLDHLLGCSYTGFTLEEVRIPSWTVESVFVF